MTVHLDHLVLGVPDFTEGLEQVVQLTGVKPIAGGSHPGQGTRNALLGLGRKCYLEILGPDPDQTPPPQPLRFDIAELKGPRLVAWCLRATDLESRVTQARGLGMGPTGVVSLSRQVPGGRLLRWRVAGLGLGPRGRGLGGAVPFLIDWGGAPHPADDLPDPVRILSFSVLYPDPAMVESVLSPLGIKPHISPAVSPGIEAILQTPNGRITLR